MEHQQIIDNLNAEKISLDQSYVDEIKKVLDLRKQHILKDKFIEDIQKQLQDLLQENADLKVKCAAYEEAACHAQSKADLIAV